MFCCVRAARLQQLHDNTSNCMPTVCIMVKSGQEILLSGVFNLLKFDHISKKERKKWIKWSIIFTPHSSQKWIFTLQYKNLPLFIWLLVETHVMYELIWDTSNSKTCSCWYCYHSWIKSVLLTLCWQLQISGLFPRRRATHHPAVLPTALSVMVHASWCLVEWWNTASIRMSSTSWTHQNGSGRNWSRNLQKLVFRHVHALVSVFSHHLLSMDKLTRKETLLIICQHLLMFRLVTFL